MSLERKTGYEQSMAKLGKKIRRQPPRRVKDTSSANCMIGWSKGVTETGGSDSSGHTHFKCTCGHTQKIPNPRVPGLTCERCERIVLENKGALP